MSTSSFPAAIGQECRKQESREWVPGGHGLPGSLGPFSRFQAILILKTQSVAAGHGEEKGMAVSLIMPVLQGESP